jgi:predicted branched-subunit amino acid permease
MLREDQPPVWRATKNPGRTADRVLLGVPTFTAIAFGLIFMLGRFIALLREDLKEAPNNLATVALLVGMIGGVTAIVLMVCTAVGLTIGCILRSCFAKRLTMALRRHSGAGTG